MSTFAANLVTDLAGTTSPEFSRGELCRARFNLNGTGTIAERDSFNVSSYTDNGTGDYTATFTTAFPNANYTPTALVGPTIGSTAEGVRPVSATTSAYRATTNSNTTPTDFSIYTASFHGDRV